MFGGLLRRTPIEGDNLCSREHTLITVSHNQSGAARPSIDYFSYPDTLIACCHVQLRFVQTRSHASRFYVIVLNVECAVGNGAKANINYILQKRLPQPQPVGHALKPAPSHRTAAAEMRPPETQVRIIDRKASHHR